MAMLVPLFALGLMMQARDSDIRGSVVNRRDEPVSQAAVLVYLEYVGFHDPVLLAATTDDKGQFRVGMSRLVAAGWARAINGGRSWIFAFQRGSPLAVGRISDRTHRLVLPDAAPRLVTVKRADGKALCGIKVMPRLIHVFNGAIAEIPTSLAAQLAATTDPGNARDGSRRTADDPRPGGRQAG